jgi:hypothetical protein
MSRGRKRAPIELPWSDYLYLLGYGEVVCIMETRWKPIYVDRSVPRADFILLAWPVFVLRFCEILAIGHNRVEALWWYYRQDKQFVADMMSTVTRCFEKHHATPPSKWNWERLVQELFATDEPTGGSAEDIILGSFDPQKVGDYLPYKQLLERAQQLGCGTDPFGPIPKEALTLVNFQKRVPDTIAAMKRKRDRWKKHLDALWSVESEDWSRHLPGCW